MAITWGEPGTRFYETGIEKAAIYYNSNVYPWVGLTSVIKNPSIASRTPIYIDGIKVGEKTIYKEVSGTINAFTYPDILLLFEGFTNETNGLHSGDQISNSLFNLVYRTNIGNDLDGLSHGTKIHCLYNVSITPSSDQYESFTDNPTPTDFSWEFTTTPLIVSNAKPLSYLVFDSRSTPPDLFETVVSILDSGALLTPEWWRYMAVNYVVTPPTTAIYPGATTYPGASIYPGS